MLVGFISRSIKDFKTFSAIKNVHVSNPCYVQIKLICLEASFTFS